jgi:plastocyanin
MKVRGTILAVVTLALMTAACSSKSTPSGTTSPAATSGGGGGGGSTTITAQNFAFSPGSVNVSSGSVTLSVTNKDSTEHTFTLDDGSSNTNLDPGKTVSITLDLTKTVGWHCSIHPTMKGTLNVG